MNIRQSGVCARDAEAIVLELYNSSGRECDGEPERYVIQHCELSPRGDYWIVRCNTEDCVVHNIFSRCLVGVNAHLVDVNTGEVGVVCSAMSVDDYLQDQYDLATAAGDVYVLGPAFDRRNKAELIHLRQKLECTYAEVFALLSGENAHWLTGTARILRDARQLLASQGIQTRISVCPNAQGAVSVGVETWHVEAVLKAVRRRVVG